MSSGRRSALTWPARAPHTGDIAWLSSGQRSLLFYLRGQLARGRHTFTIDELAAASGIHRSNVSRGLDRLASLTFIGRRCTRGRNGRTLVWLPRAARARAEAVRRATTWPTFRRVAQRGVNVATSTPYGGFLTREGWRRAIGAGDERAVRRLTPPRTLYGRCAARHRVRLNRWHFRRYPGSRGEARSFDGTWLGTCRRCADTVRLSEHVTIPAAPASEWVRAGDIARRRVM